MFPVKWVDEYSDTVPLTALKRQENSVEHLDLTDKQKGAALDGALTQIERQFGKGTVMRMGDDDARLLIERDGNKIFVPVRLG